MPCACLRALPLAQPTFSPANGIARSVTVFAKSRGSRRPGVPRLGSLRWRRSLPPPPLARSPLPQLVGTPDPGLPAGRPHPQSRLRSVRRSRAEGERLSKSVWGRTSASSGRSPGLEPGRAARPVQLPPPPARAAVSARPTRDAHKVVGEAPRCPHIGWDGGMAHEAGHAAEGGGGGAGMEGAVDRTHGQALTARHQHRVQPRATIFIFGGAGSSPPCRWPGPRTL
jgi:hypothetical protein